jgi:putative nucleotidyltransferase with HDIG domain
MSSTYAASAPRPERIDLILNQLDQLPTLPQVAIRVLQATRSKSSSARDVVNIISSDQSLCTKILSLVGKASVGAARDVSTVHQAVVLLGFEAVRHAVLSVAVFGTFSKMKPTQASRFDRKAFWRHSLAVACAARLIAERWRTKVDPEVACVCGLLHDIGKVALDACLPKSYDRVAAMAASRRVSIMDVEREVLGLDHTMAGKRLAQRWRLPEGIAECVWLHHHSPDVLPDGVRHPDLVQIVNLSDTWAREQRLGNSGTPMEGPSSADIAAQMNLPGDHLAEVAAQMPAQIAQRAELLGLDTTVSAEMYSQAAASANVELVRMAGDLATSNKRVIQHNRTLDAINRLHGASNAVRSPGDVCLSAATLFGELSGLAEIIVFATRRDGGVFYVGLAGPQGPDAEVFAAPEEIGTSTIGDTPPGETVLAQSAPAAQVVLERYGDRLGSSAHRLLPLVRDGAELGGILFAADSTLLKQVQALTREWALFASAVVAEIDRAYDHLDAERLQLGLADVNRRLKATQQEVARARSLKMVAEMAGGAAHEMNNPLAVISGRAELLGRQTGDSKIQQGLEIILAQAHRCSGIVNELMDFAKPEEPKKERVNLASLVSETADEWRKESDLAEDQLILSMRDRDINADVDPVQIRVVLRELFKNAVEACEPERASLKVNCARDASDEHAEVTVADNGCGMAAEVVEKAADPFFSHKPSGRGRGLGLSRALRWCEINGGQLRIESQPGEGTQVWMQFPLSADPSA